jgi:hypothetical protein
MPGRGPNQAIRVCDVDSMIAMHTIPANRPSQE